MLAGHHTDDPAVASAAAGEFLRRDPITNNVVLTILDQRIAQPEPGNYWWVTDRDDVVGFAACSPVAFRAIITAMPAAAVGPLVEMMWATAPRLSGVKADAATAALVAGAWTERARVGGFPVEGERIYRLGSLRPPATTDGRFRPAVVGDLATIVDWLIEFGLETGSTPLEDTKATATAWIDGERLWVWDRDSRIVAMARATVPVAGVSRIGAVFTPPAARKRGSAAALVSAVSGHLLASGVEQCMLYTQLSNPTSNAIYRRLGYEPVGEVMSYDFRSSP